MQFKHRERETDRQTDRLTDRKTETHRENAEGSDGRKKTQR